MIAATARLAPPDLVPLPYELELASAGGTAGGQAT